jgi:hypothetical protein
MSLKLYCLASIDPISDMEPLGFPMVVAASYTEAARYFFEMEPLKVQDWQDEHERDYWSLPENEKDRVVVEYYENEESVDYLTWMPLVDIPGIIHYVRPK